MAIKRPPGRPPLDPGDRSVQLSTSVPSKQWARLREKARSERVDVHELVRRLLALDTSQNKSI